MNALRKLSFVMLIAIVAVAAFGVQPNRGVEAQEGSLTLWHSWRDAEADLLETWVANFTEANEGVEIEARYVPFDDLRATYENAAATGEGPDLVIGQADWAGPLSEAGLIMPIDDMVADTDLDTQLTEAAWGTMSFAGERYGVPVTLDGVALYYNSDIIDPDDVPEDLEELLEVAAELTEGDDVGLMFNNGFYQSAGIYFALGGELFNEDGENLWNEGDAAEAYLDLHKMIFENYPEFITSDNALFQEGRAAMILEGSWNLGTFTEALGDSLGVALLPEVDGEPWSPFVGGKGFYVNATTENVDTALAFLTYVTSPEGLTLGAEIANHIPTGEGVEVENENIAVFSEQLSGGTPLPTSPAMGAYWNPVGDAITSVTQGGEESAAAAEAATEDILDLLEGDE
jgi:maltose-binding protein MalE